MGLTDACTSQNVRNHRQIGGLRKLSVRIIKLLILSVLINALFIRG